MIKSNLKVSTVSFRQVTIKLFLLFGCILAILVFTITNLNTYIQVSRDTKSLNVMFKNYLSAYGRSDYDAAYAFELQPEDGGRAIP